MTLVDGNELWRGYVTRMATQELPLLAFAHLMERAPLRVGARTYAAGAPAADDAKLAALFFNRRQSAAIRLSREDGPGGKPGVAIALTMQFSPQSSKETAAAASALQLDAQPMGKLERCAGAELVVQAWLGRPEAAAAAGPTFAVRRLQWRL